MMKVILKTLAIIFLIFGLTILYFFVSYNKMRDVEVQDVEIQEIPFIFEKGLIVLPVNIQGNQYKFMVDTGSFNSIIFDRTLKKNIQKSPYYMFGFDINNNIFLGNIVEFKDFNIDNKINFNKSQFEIIDYTPTGDFSGIIGNNILSKYNIEIDFKSKNIKFSTKYAFTKGKILNSKFTSNKVYYYIYNEKFMVDTGASITMTTNDSIIINNSTDKRKVYGFVQKGLAKDNKNPKQESFGKIPSLKFSGWFFKNVDFYTSNKAKNILGSLFLNNFCVSLNYLDKTSYASLNDETDFEFNKFGLRTSNEGVVEYVISKSISDKKGIRPGDKILKVNNTDFDRVKYTSYWEKKELHLLVQKNKKVDTIQIIQP